ncbi:MAG: CoB--CoM heterodisulfide reductase iron-sulfur subunit B family protein [Chloroflexota bacterium]|nr:CoB--CoM heterodisulfide reductase iron-sulfur subunit B family protein [Chloroflexota bacterium]
MGFRLAFYPGCLVLQRMPEYEASTRAVLRALGIELEIVQQATCCGSPVAESFTADWVYLAAYNLALVERMGHRTVITVCGGCTNTLTRAARALQNPVVRDGANQRLEPFGLSVTGQVDVKHLVWLLAEREDEVQARIVRPLSLRVALTNPCQAFRPGDMMGFDQAQTKGFDDPMEPQSMRRLVKLTGAEVVEYGGENECCGATLYLANPDLSLAAGRRKLEATQDADLLLHGCGNCQLLLRRFQRMIIQDERNLRKQALFLPQLVGLAMGLPEDELGLREGAWR